MQTSLKVINSSSRTRMDHAPSPRSTCTRTGCTSWKAQCPKARLPRGCSSNPCSSSTRRGTRSGIKRFTPTAFRRHPKRSTDDAGDLNNAIQTMDSGHLRVVPGLPLRSASLARELRHHEVGACSRYGEGSALDESALVDLLRSEG